MSHALYVKRIIALENARRKAKDPEWKALWENMLKQLINKNNFEEKLN